MDSWNDFAVAKIYDLSKKNINPAQDIELESKEFVIQEIQEYPEMLVPEDSGLIQREDWSRPATNNVEVANAKSQTGNATKILRKKKKRKPRWKRGKNCGQSVDVKKPWMVGDACMAFYGGDGGDGGYYEATIKEINEEGGTVLVNYHGYEDCDVLAVREIFPVNMKADADKMSSLLVAGNRRKIASKRLRTTTKKSAKKGAFNPSPPFNQILPNSSTSAKCSKDGTSVSPPPSLPFPQLVPNSCITPPLIPLSQDIASNKALSSMLQSWYMAGYHTGYHRGLTHNNSHNESS